MLQPSRRTSDWEELFGIALVEAMACGCVPVASDHVGPSAILSGTPLADGLLPEGRFPADARRLLLDADDAALAEWSAAAKRRAHEFELDAVAARWRPLLVGP